MQKDQGSLSSKTAPIRGSHLEDAALLRQLNTVNACWLFGLPMTKWIQLTRRDGAQPVKNPTHALLVHMLVRHPEACPIRPSVDVNDVMSVAEAAVKQYNKTKLREAREAGREDAFEPRVIDKKRLSIMFGREASGGYRWITKGSRIPPSLARLFYIFMKLSDNKNAARELVKEWIAVVETESKSRGISDIWSHGRWTRGSTKPAKRARKKRASAAAA